MSSQRLLLLITGMAGSGKTTLSVMLREKGYTVFTMGDVIRHEVRMRNQPPTPENLGKMAEQIRKTGGDAAVARKCIPLIIGEPNNKVALDGVRSLDEVYALQEAFKTYLVAVHASPESRYQRLKDRGRSDDPRPYPDCRRLAHFTRHARFAVGTFRNLHGDLSIRRPCVVDQERRRTAPPLDPHRTRACARKTAHAKGTEQ